MPKPRPSNEWLALLGLGTEIGALVLIWVGIGYLVDRYVGWRPYGLLVGSLIGVFHALWRLLRAGGGWGR
ncbi:MAG: hypothetical protein KatS3mg026_0185 [Bacteroidia bacterium]|nr:MAG: hypothetical protein KatS3mg026_0185 [Bacteroidia bacterium]